uniref:Uncharacterized protein MANES_14G000600 n=1 Tax=Rhizophora mucronata TaxID=61149 RepID=A0A2P2IYF2_RHIMU
MQLISMSISSLPSYQDIGATLQALQRSRLPCLCSCQKISRSTSEGTISSCLKF